MNNIERLNLPEAICAVLGILALSACAPTANSPANATPAGVNATLTVYAAASLQDAFSELSRNYENAHPGVNIAFNFGGSQQLAQQISQGAPVDLFASANQAQMNVAIQSGRIVSATARPFVRNRLVVVLPKANPAGITSLQDLGRPGLKLVFAAKEVPAGQYTLDFLSKTAGAAAFPAGYRDAVLRNIVSYEDNVRSVLSKVALDEADAGVVYTTDITRDTADKVIRIEIPDQYNTIATYPIASLKDSRHPELADGFTAYILSDAGQTIMASYGFMPVSGR